MALLNFKKRFAPLVESGTKTHTIRAWRKHPIREGEMLHLYTGLRQKERGSSGDGLARRRKRSRLRPVRIVRRSSGSVSMAVG